MEELQGAGTLSSSCPWWRFQMKCRHPNQAYSLSFYPDVLRWRLPAPPGWPRAVCHSHALEKLSRAAAAPWETGRMARNKRNLLQESRSQPTPGTPGKLGQQHPLLPWLHRHPVLLWAVPLLGLNKASLQRIDLLLNAGAYGEPPFCLLLLHPFFVPQAPMIPADEAEANTGNPGHWEL